MMREKDILEWAANVLIMFLVLVFVIGGTVWAVTSDVLGVTFSPESDEDPARIDPNLLSDSITGINGHFILTALLGMLVLIVVVKSATMALRPAYVPRPEPAPVTVEEREQTNARIAAATKAAADADRAYEEAKAAKAARKAERVAERKKARADRLARKVPPPIPNPELSVIPLDGYDLPAKDGVTDTPEGTAR